MRQEEIDRLLQKIERSAQDVPIPEGLKPEQMMKKLAAMEPDREASGQEAKDPGQKATAPASAKEQQQPEHAPGSVITGNSHNNRRKWRRPLEYGAFAAAALITVLTVAQIRNASISIEPGGAGMTAGESSSHLSSGETQAVSPSQEGIDQATPPQTDAAGAEAGASVEEESGTESKEYTASSYKEIFEKIKIYGNDRYREETVMEGGAVPTMAAGGTDGAEAAMPQEADKTMKSETGTTDLSKEFSQTNVQVEGVDEGDIVKTDGTYLYIMSSDTGRIQIMEANGKNPKKRGVIPDTSTARQSRSIQEFYINGDTLSVIRHGHLPYEEPKDNDDFRYSDPNEKRTGSHDAIYRYAYPAKSVTWLETYDITDRDHPKLLGTVTQDGTYKSSRRVDDYIYLFTSYNAYDLSERKKTENYIPAVNGKLIPFDNIYIPEHVDSAGYLVVSSVDMKHPDKTTSEKAVLARGETFYVSSSGIYIGTTRYDGKADQYDYTELMKLSYRNGRITFKAHGNVDGYLNDQFSMDEYQGKLRLVSTLSYNSGISTNSLFVLDENLKVIGEIEDLAPGEQIYSARFMEDIGYFVTFRNMDPLFSVDLSNPRNPKILGELKITGFSEYLHPYDENLLLGIGREISPDTGNFKGLKLSMFDISDPEDVTEIQKLVEKSYEYSPAWDHHKAVAVSSGRNIIGFSVEEYDKTSRTWDYRYVVYAYDKNQGFQQVLSHKLQNDYDYQNTRGLYIGQYFYVVESSRVTVFDMKKFVQAGQVKY